jgi:hypothetical protein
MEEVYKVVGWSFSQHFAEVCGGTIAEGALAVCAEFTLLCHQGQSGKINPRMELPRGKGVG